MLIPYTYALTLCNWTASFGSRMVLALFALKLGAHPLAVGALSATFSIFPMSLSWITGRLSDRFGSRWLLTAGTFGSCTGMVVPWLAPGLPSLFVAAAMNGVAFSFYNVSMQNLVGVLSAPQQRARNYANFSLVVAAASFLAPLAGGAAIDHSGHARACLYFALFQVVPLVLLAVWGRRLPAGSGKAQAAGGLRALLGEAGIWMVLATSSLVVAGVDLFQFYLPIYGHAIGLTASAIGGVMSAYAAAAFVVRIVLSRLIRGWGETRLLSRSFWLGAASFAVLPLFSHPVALGAVAFLFGLGMGCGQPLTMMLAFSHSAAGRSGEALGLRLTANHLTRVVGPLVFGSIGSALGLGAVFWVNGLLLASGAWLTRREADSALPDR